MNTRLQVEHPVTEAVLGIDLVEWQLRVAAGEPLPAQPTAPRGHAFEARVYAEDPRNGYLPAGGRVEVLSWPERDVRIDAAVEQGDRVVTDYDALLAKVIVHGATREAALQQLESALLSSRVEGVTTNLAALVALTRDADFRAARMTTALIDARGDSLLPELAVQFGRAAQLATAALLTPDGTESIDPWAAKDNWRVQGHRESDVRFVVPGATAITGKPVIGTHISSHVAVFPDEVRVWLDGEFFRLARVARGAPAESASGGGQVLAPMPGAVLEVRVTEGERVSRGQPLVVLEAMKMEHTLRAAVPGRVSSIDVHSGQRVRDGERLLSIEAESAG